jgi:hypothetical protein
MLETITKQNTDFFSFFYYAADTKKKKIDANIKNLMKH